MKNECNITHKINFSEICCIKYLTELDQYSENRQLTEIFSKLLLKTLTINLEQKEYQFPTLKLELVKNLIDVLSKHFSRLFFLGNY